MTRFMAYPTLTKRLLDALDRYSNPRAQMYKFADRWEAIPAQEMLRRIAGLSQALVALGVRAGDRVGLFSPNRPEWHIADFAIMGLGAVDVPIYFNEAPDRLVYILNHSGAKVVFAAGEEQAKQLQANRRRLNSVEHVIVAGGPPEMDDEVLRYEALVATASEREITAYRRSALSITANQLATLIYTSGTTGEPKGVMLTHANISSNDLDSARKEPDYSRDDVGLSFLPLAHVYERLIDYGYFFRGVSVAYVERPEIVQSALREVRPTITAAVPRVFEKIYANIMETGRKATGRRRRIFDWAMRVAHEAVGWRAHGRPVSAAVKFQWVLANALVYRKIRAGLGGRLRVIFSGAAPLSLDLLEFFWTVGVPIYQGYGLTETSPVVSSNYSSERNKVGTVGQPIANVEVRIAEDGEILVRGPCVMQGYYQKPAETREALLREGWLRTGDVGYLDDDGYLVITDRKKDLIKTAAGKFVAPQPIENSLRTSPYIANVVVIGDRRRFVSALIVPNFSGVEAEARTVGIEFRTRAELVAHPWVRELIGKEIDHLTGHLAQYESIKRFVLLEREFTFENGELTYTMKLRRRVIEQRYDDVIERLYGEVEEPQPFPPA